MSAHGMHPTFTDRAGYEKWLTTWRSIYGGLSAEIRTERTALKNVFRNLARAYAEEGRAPIIPKAVAARQRELHYRAAMAKKLMSALADAKARMARITAMNRQIADQMASFPLTLECDTVEFHFNKGSIEFPNLPAWTLKAKGRSFYVNSVDFSGARGSTRETPDHPSTKGSIRFRRCRLTLSADGTARIVDRVDVAQAA